MGHTTLNEVRKSGLTPKKLGLGVDRAKVGECKLRNFTYVDHSNLLIEGQRIQAVKKGLAPSLFEAMNRKVVDTTWAINYGKLRELVCGNPSEIGGAKLWASERPRDAAWKKAVEANGFEVQTFERSFSGAEKKVDVAIAHRMTKDAYTIINKAVSEITLVSGDKDFVPVVADMVADGFQVVVIFWDQAARELRKAASSFVSLNKWHSHLSL